MVLSQKKSSEKLVFFKNQLFNESRIVTKFNCSINGVADIILFVKAHRIYVNVSMACFFYMQLKLVEILILNTTQILTSRKPRITIWYDMCRHKILSNLGKQLSSNSNSIDFVMLLTYFNNIFFSKFVFQVLIFPKVKDVFVNLIFCIPLIIPPILLFNFKRTPN